MWRDLSSRVGVLVLIKQKQIKTKQKQTSKQKTTWNYILNLRDIKITVLIDIMCLISNAYLSLSLCFSLCRYFRVTACKLPQNVDPQLDLFQKQTFKAQQWFSRTVCATMFGLGWVSLAVLYRDFFTFPNATIFTIGSLINPEDKLTHCSRQFCIHCHGSGNVWMGWTFLKNIHQLRSPRLNCAY